MPSPIKSWLPTLVVLILAGISYVKSEGVMEERLSNKATTDDVREIVVAELQSRAFDKSRGDVLETKVSHVKEHIAEIRKRMDEIGADIKVIAKNSEIYQTSRSTANANINEMPNIAITPWAPPGARERTPIGRYIDE